MTETKIRPVLGTLLCAIAFAIVNLNSLTWAADQGMDDPLPRDSNNVYGSFDNGVKYIIRKAANPPGKVTLNMRVNTGARNESDAQNGLAHFLEHMAFKGSKHYGPMQLIPLLSHLGMTFGADTNAHTNLTETVFKLSMPDTKPETIDTALTIFSDYASELSLFPIQIEAERRVILEESRTRKSAGQRMEKVLNKQLFAGTLLATHDVIGDEDEIKTFPQSEFLDYWNTWYRPENMTLVVAGDIDPQKIIDQAKAKLGSFTARTTAREPKKIGIKPFDSARAIILSDPEQVTANIQLLCIKPPLLVVKTYGQYRHELIAGIGEWIVNRRFSDRVTRGDAPYQSADVGASDFYLEGLAVAGEAQGQPQDWQKMLAATIEGIHGAVDFGFTEQELDLAKKSILSSAEWSINTEPTEDSRNWVTELITEVGDKRPIMSAQQQLDLTRQVLSSLTKEQVQDGFKENFDTRNYAYVLMLPAPKDNQPALPTPDAVLASASTDWANKTKAIEETKSVTSILPTQPVTGKVVSKETNEKLGITTVVFENGVVLHHKFLDTKKDQVMVSILLPGGVIEETADNKGVSELASELLRQPATHRLNSTAVRDLMTGKNVSVSGRIGLDAMTLSVDGSPKDLPLGLELANGLLTDGVLEQSAMDVWKKHQLDELVSRKTSAIDQLREAMNSTVGAGDIRLVASTADSINHLSLPMAQEWFDRIARHSAIEVSIVGDISFDRGVELIGQYIGSLPSRTGTFTDLDSLRKLNRPGGPYAKTIVFPGITPTAIVLAGYVGCDENNLDRRWLSMASMILTEQMIQRIRIKENLVYSINCASQPGQGMPGTGMIFAAAPTDPKNADKLSAVILEMIKALADTGPTDQEVVTAKKQLANSLETQMKEPSFWLAQTARLKYSNRKLAELEQIPAVYQTFTADQVRDVLKKYVKHDMEISLETIPKSAADAATTKEASR